MIFDQLEEVYMICYFKCSLLILLFFFTEQNLKRLRDINEEIQKLRMVNSHRGSREVHCVQKKSAVLIMVL